MRRLSEPQNQRIMEVAEIYKKANSVMPEAQNAEKNAYVRGFVDGMLEASKEPEDFYSKLAGGLRELWPPGEKDGKYPWRDSVKNLKTRLEFLWRDRKFKDKYSIEQCLSVARKYLSQYEDNAKYMQTLKYFIFKQEPMTNSKGKTKITYKSTFADMLEDNTSVSNPEFFEELGELV